MPNLTEFGSKSPLVNVFGQADPAGQASLRPVWLCDRPVSTSVFTVDFDQVRHLSRSCLTLFLDVLNVFFTFSKKLGAPLTF